MSKLKDFIQEIDKIESLSDLSIFEDKIFSRKNGLLTLELKSLKDLPAEDRDRVGGELHALKKDLEDLIAKKKAEFEKTEVNKRMLEEKIDITETVCPPAVSGVAHPIFSLSREIEDFFSSHGFAVLDGPELESDYYNFEAVNVPKDHPARDMQDTFYIKDHPDWVMRTHTSSVQVRAMRRFGAPLKAIIPGRVFRNEATDVRHEHTFYQLEGVVVGKQVNFSEMKGVLEALAKHLYGDQTEVRLRPKFYPFVEPGVNGEVTCHICHGAGCRLCKGSGWLEVFGAGMIHRRVLEEGGIDPEVYRGFAFGLGFNRLVMIKYGIEDIRHFLSGNLRFLEKFKIF